MFKMNPNLHHPMSLMLNTSTSNLATHNSSNSQQMILQQTNLHLQQATNQATSHSSQHPHHQSINNLQQMQQVSNLHLSNSSTPQTNQSTNLQINNSSPPHSIDTGTRNGVLHSNDVHNMKGSIVSNGMRIFDFLDLKFN